MLNISPRDYQNSIFSIAKDNNTLVVLPTGLGKTLIALMLAVERKKLHPLSRILILAPTRPLVEQHFQSFKKLLPELFADLQIFTGSVSAKERKKIFQTAEIIFSTPQCIANDLKHSLYSLNDVSLLVIDEAHRCLKNYDYTKVIEFYKRQAPVELQRILGLTASPGSDPEIINQICEHLNISQIESRTRYSEDVKPYLQELEFNKVEVEFPKEFIEIKVLLQRIWDNAINKLRERNILHGPANKITILKLQARLSHMISSGNFSAMSAVSLTATAIKISHALELLETQTLSGLNEYFLNLINQAKEQKSRAVQTLVKSPEFSAANISLQHLLAKKAEHPKLQALSSLISQEFSQNTNAKIIVFSQFRETASNISSLLNQLPNIKSSIFIGQAKKSNTKGISSGFSQKEQKEVIEKFKTGEINILCATSIGEEGLDIPEVNAVVFYEPIPSAIRKIQRAGRTARLAPGKLFVLITKDTRDEINYYASSAREKKMHKALETIKQKLKLNPSTFTSPQSKTLSDFQTTKPHKNI
jgi:Fanconi anemia group M protein